MLKIFAYWDANMSPPERSLCWEKKVGPPFSLRLSIRERLLANAQSEVRPSQWVCTYLTMFVSPSHPQHHTGVSQGLMAPSPATYWVSRSSSSMAQTPMPARLMKTAPQQCLQSSSPPSPPLPTQGGASLAEHRAVTVLQCWKRLIWLCRWFDQQALLKEKRLCLQTLCRGTSTYASSVPENCRPPPTPTKKSSNLKVLNHPFRTLGQPLPPWKMRGRHKRPHRCPG